jgi:preprotein translocase subunit SecG
MKQFFKTILDFPICKFLIKMMYLLIFSFVMLIIFMSFCIAYKEIEKDYWDFNNKKQLEFKQLINNQ